MVGDGITNVNQITLNGAAAAGGTVKIFDGTTLIGTAVADSDGLWSYATAALADGNHTFSGKAIDAAGNLSVASGALKVTVDTVAPNKPNFTGFAPDGHVVASGTTDVNQVTLKGGALANSTVEIFDGATQIGTATVDGNGVWSFVTETLSDGGHSLTSKAMDAAGNLSTASAALNITVATTTASSTFAATINTQQADVSSELAPLNSSAHTAFVFDPHPTSATGGGTMSDISSGGMGSKAETFAQGFPNDIQSSHPWTDVWDGTDSVHAPNPTEMHLATLRASDFHLH